MMSSSASWQRLSMSSGSNGLHWGAISQQAGRAFSHGALSSPPLKFPSSTLQFCQAACLDQLWRALLNASRRLRSCLKRRDTSSLKHTSSFAASSRPRPAPTQQTAKPTPATPEPRSPEGWRDRGRSQSARRRVSLPPDHPTSSL